MRWVKVQMVGIGILGGAAWIAGGCAKRPAPPPAAELLQLEQVPEAAMTAARKRLPDVTFETAWKKKEDGREVYEVRGKTAKGKTFEVEVTPEGEVVEVE